MSPVVSARTRRGRGFRGPGSYLAAAVEVGGRRYSVCWSVAGGTISDRLDPVVAATLLPAMRTGSSMRFAEPASTSLLANLPKIQRLLSWWDPSLTPVTIEAPAASPVRRSPRTAAFFSGGVDSFHTALQHLDQLDALVFVHGFDIRIERRGLLAEVSLAARRAADELGKPLVEVRTDIKRMSREFAPWSWFHGSALASVALLLSPMFGRLYIPGSLSYDYAPPYGSHPLLDPLWNTDAVEMVYDGFDTNRLEKTEVVARNPVAMRWLRVCNERDDDSYNCGRCEKCLRTMVSLELMGTLRNCLTLPDRVDPAAVSRLRPVWNRDLWQQNLVLAERIGAPREFVGALRHALDRGAPATAGWRVHDLTGTSDGSSVDRSATSRDTRTERRRHRFQR